jgi:GH18 family chitinase
MTYGMTSATYHADYTKMREAVETLLQTAGITPSKIFLGLPMYGTHKERGGIDTQAYHDLAADLADDPVRRHNAYELGDGYLVDSPAAIQAKVRFAQQKGLGGVFFWELGQDKDRVLLEAAARQVGKHIPVVDDPVVSTTTTTASATEEEEEEEEPEPAEDLSENAAVPDRDEL